jgi:hypothetical protein
VSFIPQTSRTPLQDPLLWIQWRNHLFILSRPAVIQYHAVMWISCFFCISVRRCVNRTQELFLF